ncbi:MAG: hypothetical protein M3Z27_04520 [Actinomycetota bacterium]|nr:hypothetical protein [Actinomycetota bacterium]
MQEILPGLFHWSAFHEPIGARVSSLYVAPAGVVIDPKEPEEGLESLPGKPQQVLLTSGHHHRDAARFAEAFGIPIRASHPAAEHIGDRLTVEVFAENEEVAPGVRAIHIGKISADEGAFHLSVAEGVIAFADGLIRYGETLSFVPDELIGEHPERVKEGLRDAFRGLLTRDFDHLVFAHGDPLIGGGKALLRKFAAAGEDQLRSG